MALHSWTKPFAGVGLSTAAASLWRSPLQGWPLGSGSLAPQATSAHVGSFGLLRGGVGGSQLGCHRPWQVRWIELQPSASVPVPSIPGSRAFEMRSLPPGPWHPAPAPWRLDLGGWPSKCDPRPGPSRRWALAPSPRRPRHLAHGVQLMAPTLSALSGAPATFLSQSLPCLGSRAFGTRPLASRPWHPMPAPWRPDLRGWPSKRDPRPGPSRRWALAPSPRRPRHLARGVQLMAPTLSALPGAPATHAWRHPWTRVVGAPSAAAPRLPDLGAQAWGQH